MRIVPLGIVVDGNKILMVHRRFPPVLWGPPGGYSENDESLYDTVVREVYEESGVTCEAVEVIGEYDAFDSHLVLVACKYIAGDLKCSYESTNVGWFDIHDLPKPMCPPKDIFQKALETINK